MNFFSPSTSQHFPKETEGNARLENQRSISVPYDSPRVSQLPTGTFNLSTAPTVPHNSHNNNVPIKYEQPKSLSTLPAISGGINNLTINNENQSDNPNLDTNKLQNLILQHGQQSQNTSANNIENNSGNTSSNFYAITQYILQSYFKVSLNDLPNLKLIDLIVDQTYPDSLTLRKLNDSSSFQTYEYFNTISRDADISRCPIFALSVYFVIRWSHPTQPITISNFNEISLLEPSLISMDSNPAVYIQNQNNGRESGERLPRSKSFEPSKRLIGIVFPWLSGFKQDMLTVDRTNYKLHSMYEVFEFMARVLIQDLKYLTENPSLLPNIVSFISKFIPDLFVQDEFQQTRSEGHSEEGSTQHHIYPSNSMNNDLSMIGFSDNNGQSSATKNQVSQLVESHFTELSKKLTTENIRLSQQITQLKYDLGSLTSVCGQILQVQRQLLSGASGSSTNTPNAISNNNQNNPKNSGGIIILDRNSVNPNILNSIVQSFDNNQSNQSPNPNLQYEPTMPSTLAPIGYNGGSNAQSQTQDSLPLSNQQLPSIGQTANNIVQADSGNAALKRKLPMPRSNLQQSVSSPFAMSPGNSGRVLGGPDSPYNPNPNSATNINKRFRLDERPTPSQAALDSLLYKPVPSPKYTDGVFNRSRNGSAQINLPNFSGTSDVISSPHTDTLAGNLLTSKIGTPVDRDGISMLSPMAEPMDQMMSNKLDRSYLQNENSTSTDHENQTSLGRKPSVAERPSIATALATSDQTKPKGNTSQSSNIPTTNVSRLPPNLGEKIQTKLPTITNTFRRTTQLTAGNQSSPNTTESQALSTIASQSNMVPTIKYQPKEKKEGENNRPSGPNENIKYKLSRDNKTIWDLYAEWYIGLNGKRPIKKLIEDYGWRRWKVSEDSHFFPTRRIIIDYIEMEVDRGIRLGRFKNPDQPREDIRKILVSDLEKFRINNVLTLNSLSLYFRYMTKKGKEICIFEDFKNWNVRLMSEDEKAKSCKRSHLPAALASAENSASNNPGTKGIQNLPVESIPSNRSKSNEDDSNSPEHSTKIESIDKSNKAENIPTQNKPDENTLQNNTPNTIVETGNTSKEAPQNLTVNDTNKDETTNTNVPQNENDSTPVAINDTNDKNE